MGWGVNSLHLSGLVVPGFGWFLSLWKGLVHFGETMCLVGSVHWVGLGLAKVVV